MDQNLSSNFNTSSKLVLPKVNPFRVLPEVNPFRVLPEVNPFRVLPEVNPFRVLPDVNPSRILPDVNPSRILPEVNPSRILLTGGAGFIGSHIADFLIENNHKVVVFDNLSTGNKKNIQHLLCHSNFKFIFGDITNIEDVRNACQNIDVICHQAAIGSVPRSINDPLTSHNNNINGFLNVLLVAKELNIKRIVYASSSSVYGDDTNTKKIENEIGKQLSPYAITKYVDELYANLFTQLYSLECIGLRYFNIFGPRQNPDGEYAAVIPKFINLLYDNKQPTIFGDGSISRDFTYVLNAVYANYLALFIDEPLCYGQIFNVGTDNSISILEVFNVIKKYLKSSIEPIFAPQRKGDIQYSNANIIKSKNLLHYTPLITFNDGIVSTINHFTN